MNKSSDKIRNCELSELHRVTNREPLCLFIQGVCRLRPALATNGEHTGVIANHAMYRKT